MPGSNRQSDVPNAPQMYLQQGDHPPSALSALEARVTALEQQLQSFINLQTAKDLQELGGLKVGGTD